MAYIIDCYNKYNRWDKEHSLYIFSINEQWYAIKEVMLNWGLPQLPNKVDQETYPESYHVWDTYENAYQFALQMKALSRQ